MNTKLFFIHSLFRAGSTYFYNALKRTGFYHVYHEPLHDAIASMLDSWHESTQQNIEQNKEVLRHDFLQSGYFDEFECVLPHLKELYDYTFSFDQYFLEENIHAPDLEQYLLNLIKSAPKVPILQCTRTSGRMRWIKHHFESINLFLLRNPWDQWYSYKVGDYIAATPWIIASHPGAPVVVHKVLELFNIPLLPDGSLHGVRLKFVYSHPLSSEQDYALFFATWLHAYIEVHAVCDLVIDMDVLSSSEMYRTQCLEKLNEIGIQAINLSDANLHRTFFDSREQKFFRNVEEQILEIYRHQGISIEAAYEYLEKARQISFGLTKQSNAHISSILEDAYRLRGLLFTRDDQIARLSQEVTEHDSETISLNQVVSERNDQITSLNQEVAKCRTRLSQLEHQLTEAKIQIQGMEQSHSWRITAPYRSIGSLLRTSTHFTKRNSLLSRTIFALLLTPGAVVFYGGLFPLIRRLRSGHGTFVEIIANQTRLRDLLLTRNRLLRWFVFASFALVMRIQRAGSVKRSLTNFLRIIHSEGFAGIRGRMVATAPGMAAPLQTDAGRPAEFPVLPEKVARRILVADYRVPRPDVSAGEHATVGILKDLCALGYEVVFLPNDMMPSLRYEAELRVAGVQLVTRESGFDYSSQYLEKHGSEFGAFYFIRVDVAETLLPVARKVAPDARIIFHAPDLYFLREMREAELRDDPAARERALQMRDRELAMMSRSDRVVVVSLAEVPVLQEVLPNTPISVFPVLYAPLIENPRPYAKRENIFFLGGFGHPPNVSAVQWFVAEVWPHVRKTLPEVEFHIIGAEAPDAVVALGKLPGIKVVGFVPELDPILEILRVGVAPLQYGAGIKGKVAVTMGAGIPCVCTEVAAEGMGIKNKVHALVENDPVRFAQAIVALYQDEEIWSRLARNGQALVQDKFGDAANRASLLKVLDKTQALPIFLFVDHCQAVGSVAVPNPGAEAAVDVSIIVPVYNKWNLTRACLTSIVQTSMGSGVTYEIILADDGSTDETVHAIGIFPGLRVIKTPENLGFLRNCNNAAKQVRGRYILFLNNDTVVLPGWLESLYHTIESDETVAVVGSKLLYLNGKIQEAGAALFKDGTAINIGRGFSRYAEIFNLSREVDFISGISILVRKSFWNSADGFNEHYKNTQYKDVDLAMMARSEGLRVVYEPASEVIHFECQSYSDEIGTDYARLQEQNKAQFIAKWREVLERDHLTPDSKWYQVAAHSERGVSALVRERRKSGKLNILYFSPFPSHPSSHGNQSTIQQFAKRFQKMGHKVHFALLQSSIYSPEDEQAMKNAWDSFEILPNAKPLWADGNPIPFDGWYEEGLGERIRLLCAKYDIDIVFCSYIFQSKMLEYVPDCILKVIDTHDKMGDRYEMLRKNGQPLEFFSCSPEEEGAYLRRADVVVARRAEEASYFDSVTGRQSAVVVPHFEDPQFISRDFNKLEKVGIVASANQINLAIVSQLLEAINTKVDGKPIPFTVHIAGQVKNMVDALPSSEQSIFHQSWVKMHGFVPEIADFYNEMDVIVSPVTMGTGINVKTVQAMAYGMPLLTTSCGGKGIETGDPAHQHPDLEGLVETLFYFSGNANELSKLAMLSRQRYENFYQDGIDMLHKIFELIERRKPRLRAQSSLGLIAEGDRGELEDKIYQAFWRYYKKGDRSMCFSDPAERLRMDGAGAEEWVKESVESNKIHDEDYSVFKVFSGSDGVVLDIGANWGYSVASIWAMSPNVKIISFEPILGYTNPLQKIKDLYGEKYDFRMFGLGSSNVVVKFAIPVVNGIGISALTSASADRNKGEIECLSKYIADYALQGGEDNASIEFSIFEFTAPIRRLDDVVSEDPDILPEGVELLALKIDAEGLEGEILHGAERTLISYKPVVMLEGGNRYEGLTDFMAKLGYAYYERDGSVMRYVNGVGMAANGFFFHLNHNEEISGKGFVFE